MKNIGFAVCIITALALASCGTIKNTASNADDVYTIGGDFKHIQNDQVTREQRAIEKEQERQTALAALYKTNTTATTVNAVPTAAIASTNNPCSCNNMYPGYGTYGFNTGYGYNNNYNMMGMGYGYNTFGMGNNYRSPYSYSNYYTPTNYYYNTYSTNNTGYTENIQQHSVPQQHRTTGIGSSTPGQSKGVNASFDKPGVAVQNTPAPATGNMQVHTRSTYNNPQTSYTPVPQNYQPTPQVHTPTAQSYTPIPQATQQSYTPAPQPVYQSSSNQPSSYSTPASTPSYSTPSYSTPSPSTPSYSTPSYSSPAPRSGNGGFGGATQNSGSSSHSGGGRHR